MNWKAWSRRQLVRGLTAAVALLLLLGVSTARAWDWAGEMFDHTSHDFGVVARGAKVEYAFTLENKYEEDAHVASIASGCPCTTAKIDRESLKTWEKAHITAVIDTRGFLGRKDPDITVVFDKPFPAEVQLHLHCFIRGDVVVQPGAVQFGSVAQGTTARQKVSVSYAGRNDWKIERVECANPHLTAQTVEVARTPGQVTYDLLVTLKGDAPAGYLQDFLFLVTNDYNAQTARVPVAVEGIVTSGFTVRPSPLMLGLVEAGQAVTKQLAVQGATPFRIVGARCDDARFKFSVPEGTKTLHLIPVTFTAGQQAGKVNVTVRIQTEPAAGAALEVQVQALIVPLPSTTPSTVPAGAASF